MTREADVAVVGAGLAGLTAAARLVDAGLSAVVLEARDRVGGRTLNQSLGEGKVVEMGGQWIGPTQERIYALATELGIGVFPTHIDGEHVFLEKGSARRYRGEMPPIGGRAMEDFGGAMERLDRMARRVPVDRPWEAPQAAKLDAQTFHSWLASEMSSRRARAVMDAYMEAILADSASTYSLLHLLFYVHSATSFGVLVSFEGGAQQDRLVGGSQRLSIELAHRLDGAVVTGAPVRQISLTRDRVELVADGISVVARAAIVAVPPTLAARIAYSPPLPGQRDQLLQRLPQGSVIKVNAVYPTPFWRAEGLSGFCAGTEGPVNFAIDNSPPDGSPGVLLAFLHGDHARSLARLGPGIRRRAVLDGLASFLGPAAAKPEAYHELDWAEEEWTRGCYGAHFTPGVWTQYGELLRRPVGLIHWAGTETSPVWNGYMEGAIRSGERAATEVVAALS